MEEEEQYLSLTELKSLLEREERERGGLNMEQKYALTHSQMFGRFPLEQVPKIVHDLMAVEMMTLANAFKIVDLLPTHVDDVRAVFAKERFSLSKEAVDQVVQIVAKYL